MTTRKAKTGLDAGRLRHRVLLQEFVTTQDSEGGLVQTWEDVAWVWAAIEPLSAREFVRAEELQSKVTARITIRYRADVNAEMRIVHGSTIYNIAGRLADPVSGIEWLTLPVSEGVNDG